MKHNSIQKNDSIIHGYDDELCDNDEDDDIENVNDMEDTNAADEIESSNPEYVNTKQTLKSC